MVLQFRWGNPATELISPMAPSRSSRTGEPRRTLTYAALAFAAIALTVIVAGGAGAASVDNVQSYTWLEGDETYDNAPEHVWTPVSHANSPSDEEVEIPSKGLALVSADLTVDNDPSQIVFRYLDVDDTDDTQVDEPQEAEFVYDLVDQPPDDERDDRVHLAAHVPTNATRLQPGETGCKDVDDNPGDLGAGFDGRCWFLIELTEPGKRGHVGAERLDTSTTYNLEVEVQDGAGVENAFEREDDGDILGLLNVAPDTVVTKAEFVDPNAPGLIETGRTVTFNLTLETGNASNSRSTSTTEGDVDVWTCLYRDSVRHRPYTHFSTFTNESSSWDSSPTCDVYDLPAYGPRDETKDTFTEYGEKHTFATPLQRTDEDRGSDADDNRSYEYKFKISEEIETTGSGWTDDFVVQAITRDAFGNIEYHTFGDTYEHEGNSGQSAGPGVFQVAEFNLTAGLQQTSNDKVSTFEDEKGCFQPSDGGETAVENNTVDNPCYRSLELLPPYDAIKVPFLVDNFGNAEDVVEVSVSNPSDAGNLDWDVLPLDPNGENTDDASVLTYPIGAPSSPGASITTAPSVTFQPPEDAVAPDHRLIEVEIKSDRSTNPKTESVYLQANLEPNPRAELTLGPDQVGEHRVEVSPDGSTDIDLSYENTGNTDGPFQFGIQSTDIECVGFNQDPDENKIDIDLLDNGVEQNDFTIAPGDSRSLTVDVDVGRDVPTGEYECEITVSDGGEEVTLTPIDPTITVEVTGETNIDIFRTTDDADRDEVNITGQRTHQLADPAADSHEVVFYLENTGDIAIQPELTTTSSLFKLLDESNLDATWVGGEDKKLTIEEAADSFTLPVTDADDRDRVEITDLFKANGQINTNAGAEEVGDENDHWTCAGKDTGADSDGDPRVVCRLVFHLDYSDDNAIIGDHVVYDFRWDDPSEDSDPSNATLDLEFGYPGEIVVDSVSDRVVGVDGQTSRIVFEGRLDEGRSFDTDQNTIRAEVDVDIRDINCPVEDTTGSEISNPKVTSSSLTASTARFPVNIEFDEDQSTCLIKDGNTWSIQTSKTGPQAVDISLNVTDEEGAELRQVTPTTIRTNRDASTSQPSTPLDFDIDPAVEMPTNGSQYARVTFTDNGHWTGNGGIVGENEGILLSRSSTGENIAPYTECGLNDHAVSTDGWTRIAPAPMESVPIKDGSDSVHATEDVTGLVLQQGNNDQAIPVGQIALYGWGDGDKLEWNEGWNPLMLRLVDSTGDPAQPPTASNTPEIELTMKFAARNASDANAGGPLTHTFELSSEDDAIPIEPLGQGYYRADVYLPEGLADENHDLPADPFGDAELADHPAEGRASVDYEAWSLHAEVERGESTARQDVTGDAYWRAHDIGLVEDTVTAEDGQTADPFNGTVGASGIADAEDTVSRFQTDLETGQDADDSRRTFVHTSVRFLGGPLAPTDDWVTGPGTHNVGVFLLEETDDGQRSTERIGDNRTAKPYHEHTFQAVTDASGTMVAENQDRRSVDRAITINSDQRVEGLYNGLLRLPDTGNTNQWFGEISMSDGSGDRITPSNRPFFIFDVDPARQAASNGIPMPLCISPPAGDEGGDPDGTAGDFEFDSRREEVTLDLRSIPGMRPDRLDFAFTPVLEAGDGGIRMLNDDNDLYAGSTFHIQAPGLVSMSDELLPSETESTRDMTVRVPVDDGSVVGEIEAWLVGSGEEILSGPVELTDTDRDERYTGALPISKSHEGTRTLVVEATDSSGGVTLIEHGIDIVPNTAPQISILSPTGEPRAMPDNGTIVFAVDDGTVASLSENELRDQIDVFRATGDGGGVDLDGDELASGDIEITGIDSRVATGTTETITVNVTEDGEPAAGTVYVNISDEEEFNATLADGEADGDVTFPDEAGTIQLTVELDGEDRPNATFDVEVVDDSGSDGNFSSVPLDQLEYTFEDTTVEVAYTPDIGDDASDVTARLDANLTNEPEVSEEVTVRIDSQSPSLEVTIGDETPGSGTTIVGPSSVVSASASDDLTGVSSLSIQGIRDGGRVGSISVSSSTAQATAAELGLDSEGTASILIVAEDAAGNEERQNITVEVDSTGPSIGEADLEPAGSSLVVTVEASDENGVDGVRLFYRTPDASAFRDQRMTETDDGAFEAQIDEPGSTGGLEYFFESTDEVGNRGSDGSRNTPLLFDLDSVDLDNADPTVDITAPSEGAVVSGTIDVDLSIDDADGDTVTVEAITIDHAGESQNVDADLVGTELDVPADETFSLDTTELEDGSATLTVEVADIETTSTDSISLEIDNAADTGCAETVDLDDTDDATVEDVGDGLVCIQADPVEGATHVRIQVHQGEQELVGEVREVKEDGLYELPTLAAGDYSVTVTQFEETDEGEERELSTSSAGLSLSPPKPFGKFVTTLVLGAAVIATTAYAAFGRWS